MDTSLFLGLLYNAALLLLLSILYDFSGMKRERKGNLLRQVQSGIVIGGIGIVLMLTPWTLTPGIVFDTRSILLSMSGLFFGPFPTIIAMLVTGVFRISLGGDGALMGIAVIIFSGTSGIIWGKLRPNWAGRYYILELFSLGVLVHLLMLLCTVLLPKTLILSTFQSIALPIMLVYPIATILLGSLMVRMYRMWEKRKTREKMEESEQQFSELLQNVSMLAVIMDRNGDIQFCNDYLLKISGYQREELIGKNWMEKFVPPENRADVIAVMKDVISGGKGNLSFENNIILKDRSELTIFWNNAVIRSEDGSIIAGAALGENVTEKRIAEENLILAKRKAEESDRLKSIFLTNMSHEIRTPMNALLGFTEILSHSEFSKEEKEKYVEIVKSSGLKLMQVVDDILDISKIEAEELSLQISDCKLRGIFDTVFDFFKNSAELENNPELELRLKFPVELQELIIRTDSYRVNQVLVNLISNAIKYTEKGEIVFGADINHDLNSIRIFVSDTGIGIKEDSKTVIFERFRQVEENDFHEGSGLGLSISKGIVELLGGKIWLESVYGEGSVFNFTIPLAEGEEKNINTEQENNEILDLNGKIVIIAEDDFDSFILLKSFLKRTKAIIHHARDGKVLLEMLENNVPDLILLDINMPLISGIECMKEIKKQKYTFKIIVQTAFVEAEERDELLGTYCHGFLAKPISKSDLFKEIERVL